MMILAVFRSRAHSLDYAERLQSYGVAATTMPAPKEARIGCGLCVQFDVRFFPRVKAVLGLGKYSSFNGFYRMEYTASGLILYSTY